MPRFVVWAYRRVGGGGRREKKLIQYAGPNGADAFDAAISVEARGFVAVRAEKWTDEKRGPYLDTMLPASFDLRTTLLNLFGKET